MPKKRRVIAAEASTKSLGTAAGADKQMSNTRMSAVAIRAQTASLVSLLYFNGLQGYADANLPSSLSVQSSARLFNGATGLGGGYTSFGTTAVTVSNRQRTVEVALTPVLGNTITVNTFADAGSGKKVPLGIVNRDADGWLWGFAKNDSLTPVLDGTLANVAEGWPENSRAYFPGAITGLTNTKAVGFLGHSLVEGTGGKFYRGFSQTVGDVLNIPVFQIGIGASNVGAYQYIDRADLDLVDVVCILWTINNLNSAANVTATGTFVTNESNQLIAVIKDLHTMGKKVYMCTEGPAGSPGASTADHIAKIAAWNSHLRANAVSTMGADGVIDIASVLFTTTDSGLLKSEFIADAGDYIHWGQTANDAVGAYVAAELRTLNILGEDSGTYSEFLRKEFDGAVTTPSASVIDGLTPIEKYGARFQFALSGDGRLKVVTPASDSFASYLVPASDAGHTYGMVEWMGTYGTLSWTTVGYGVGFTRLAFVGDRVYLEGYHAYYTKSRLIITKHNGAATTEWVELGAVNLDAEPTVGQKLRLTLEWVPGAGANCNLVAKLYSESLTPLKTLTITGDSSAGIYNGSLSPVFFYRGADGTPTLEAANNASVAERFVAYDYVANTITSVTPGNATPSVAASGTVQLGATVAGTGTFPTGVNYKITSGSNLGSVNFNSGLFTAGASAGTVVVEVASANREQTANITITITAGASTITGVTIPSGNIVVAGGSTTTITPNVTGTGGFSSATTLSIRNGGAGSVSGNNYTAPAASGSAQIITLRQTSNQNGAFYAEITVTINAASVATPTVTSVTPTNGSLIFQNGGASVDLDATVQGTNFPSQTVTFELLNGLGTLNTSSGVYVSPAATTFARTATVIIRSSEDPTKMAIVTIVTNAASVDTSYTYAGGGSFVGNGGVIVPVGATQNVEMLYGTWRLVCDAAHGMLIQVLAGEVVFFLAASLPTDLTGETLVLQAGDYKLFAPSGIKLYARSRNFIVSSYIAKTPVNA